MRGEWEVIVSWVQRFSREGEQETHIGSGDGGPALEQVKCYWHVRFNMFVYVSNIPGYKQLVQSHNGLTGCW